jgi:hypothetical protein
MSTRNNSKTSDFFDKIQTIYNSGIRGELITKKSPTDVLVDVSYTLLSNQLNNYSSTNTRVGNSFLPMITDSKFYTISDFTSTSLNFSTHFNFIPSSFRSYVLDSNLYNLENGQNSKLKFKFIYKPFLKPINSDLSLTSLPLYSEDLFSNPTNFNMLNFNMYNNEMLFDSSDDSYENLKNFQVLYAPNHQNVILQSYKYLVPTTYTTVLDAFRADYDDYN